MNRLILILGPFEYDQHTRHAAVEGHTKEEFLAELEKQATEAMREPSNSDFSAFEVFGARVFLGQYVHRTIEVYTVDEFFKEYGGEGK